MKYTYFLFCFFILGAGMIPTAQADGFGGTSTANYEAMAAAGICVPGKVYVPRDGETVNHAIARDTLEKEGFKESKGIPHYLIGRDILLYQQTFTPSVRYFDEESVKQLKRRRAKVAGKFYFTGFTFQGKEHRALSHWRHSEPNSPLIIFTPEFSISIGPEEGIPGCEPYTVNNKVKETILIISSFVESKQPETFLLKGNYLK